MKNILLINTLVLLLFSNLFVYAKETPTKAAFKVIGICDMCKERIEKAAKIKGVKSVEWDLNTQIVTAVFFSSKTTLDQILQSIAKAGYDTEKYKASDSTYEALPKCCQYERKIN